MMKEKEEEEDYRLETIEFGKDLAKSRKSLINQRDKDDGEDDEDDDDDEMGVSCTEYKTLARTPSILIAENVQEK